MSQVHLRRGISPQLLLQQQNSFSSPGCSVFCQLLVPWGSHSCRDSSRTWLWCLHSAVLFITQEHSHASCVPPRKQQLHFTSGFSTVKWKCNSPACSGFTSSHLPCSWNVGGHSDTTLETSPVVFVPGVLQAFTRCFWFGLESCEPDGKLPCSSPLPTKGMWCHLCLTAHF